MILDYCPDCGKAIGNGECRCYSEPPAPPPAHCPLCGTAENDPGPINGLGWCSGCGKFVQYSPEPD